MCDYICDIIKFIEKLQESNIYYAIRSTREHSISIDVSVPGQRWEIDFINDGSIEVEIFISDGTIYDGSKLDVLLQNYSS